MEKSNSMSNRGGGGGERVIGDYIVTKPIGSGSFSVVWHGRHKVTGVEVAIKEIVTAHISKKLQDSLMSEIHILEQINHPNIIRLHDIIQETTRIHLVLEYCRGGDLSLFIQQRKGRISEAKSKHFMHQLASGLQIMRDNNVIHRDLKPQNLLLTTNDENAVLKIADFGFARPLQPRGLAETLCGSPLYMAPEIMQLQKYDAKADLWSVGIILYQLVTGKTPFSGNSQIQLLQNIMKTSELNFPPDKMDLSSACLDLCRKLLRINPVERITFEEFFNHPFLSQKQSDDNISRTRVPPRRIDGFPFYNSSFLRNDAKEILREDFLPFSPDVDSSGADKKPSFKSTFGFSAERKEVQPPLDFISKDSLKSSERRLKESLKSVSKVEDSFELLKDYVFVNGPSAYASSSSSASLSRLNQFPYKLEPPKPSSANLSSYSSAPLPIIAASAPKLGHLDRFDSNDGSVPSGTSQGSVDIEDSLEQPPTDCADRITSLKQFVSSLTQLLNEKIKANLQLEAFSIQLVNLAIWKQALHICHAQAASSIDESPSPNRETTRLRESADSELQNLCSQIEIAFLQEVENAEELAKIVEPGNTEMPDAMETIFQSALSLGRDGAVDEYMDRMEESMIRYSRAMSLLRFLLAEAPTLIINPPFSLTNTDRYRIRNYIGSLNNRWQSLSKLVAAEKLKQKEKEDQQQLNLLLE
ncbi:serine/threonine-protein kinase ATG1c-like isoform X2 [Impatiens glandulifera]|uniref:serine/threonine-protein kinase ATG1c-like isoform X2 n=1 Tax=Impatiens glandulifera TaxID=253017 RepID=UPI001FB07F07|nr:serine/threonine-protein kinase ATG1c-like isoform X2 [Impatiens glandulifera]